MQKALHLKFVMVQMSWTISPLKISQAPYNGKNTYIFPEATRDILKGRKFFTLDLKPHNMICDMSYRFHHSIPPLFHYFWSIIG